MSLNEPISPQSTSASFERASFAEELSLSGSRSPLSRPAKNTAHHSAHSAHTPLTHAQSREIPLGAEGVLALPEAALDEVESRLAQTALGDAGPDSGASEKGSHDPEKGEPHPAAEWTYPDGGWKAWSVVLGAHIFACCQMGYGMIWGVLLANLQQTVYAHESSATLNMITGLSNFAMSGCALVAGRLGEKFGYKRMLAVSATATYVSLILSAVTYEHLPGIFICQGALLGIGMGLGTPTYLSISSQWFLKRRGLATGLVGAGSGFGGAISSLIVRFLLPQVGYRKTLVIYASINAVMSAVAWSLVEIRLPPLKPGERRLPKNWLPTGVWRDGAIYSLCLSCFLGTFGFLNVPYFATPYTTFKNPTLDKHSITAAVPLIVGNVAQGFGRIGAGFVADCIGPVNAYFLSYFMGGIVQIAMWPHVSSLGGITAFTVLYNLLGAWFMVLLPVVGAQLFGVKGLATLTGLLLVANSPGQLLGGTLGGVVLDSSAGYSGLAYYSGSMMLAGAIVLLYARFNRERRVFARF